MGTYMTNHFKNLRKIWILSPLHIFFHSIFMYTKCKNVVSFLVFLCVFLIYYFRKFGVKLQFPLWSRGFIIRQSLKKNVKGSGGEGAAWKIWRVWRVTPRLFVFRCWNVVFLSPGTCDSRRDPSWDSSHSKAVRVNWNLLCLSNYLIVAPCHSTVLEKSVVSRSMYFISRWLLIISLLY